MFLLCSLYRPSFAACEPLRTRPSNETAGVIQRWPTPPGRGALSNVTGRFEGHRQLTRDETWDYDDGWHSGDATPPPLNTTASVDASRTIIATNSSPDVPFERSINPYRGCEHGRIYCFARPTHAFLGLSPGLDFESHLLAKPDAPRLLERVLAQPGYRCKVIALGTNTDPYQPIEKTRRITRGLLEVFAASARPASRPGSWWHR